MPIKTSRKKQKIPKLLIEIINGKPVNYPDSKSSPDSTSYSRNSVLEEYIGKEVAIKDTTFKNQNYLIPGEILEVLEDKKYLFRTKNPNEGNTNKESILK